VLGDRSSSSDLMKKKWQDPIFREKITSSGIFINRPGKESHYNWQGGISFEPYGVEFNKNFKNIIRERDGFCCLICGVTQEKFGSLLCVHHIDYNKTNNFIQNCVSLCRPCHGKTSFNRNQWKVFFQSLLAEKYNYIYEGGIPVLILETCGMSTGRNIRCPRCD